MIHKLHDEIAGLEKAVEKLKDRDLRSRALSKIADKDSAGKTMYGKLRRIERQLIAKGILK